MSTPSLLLRTPEPHPRESIQGYILRVTEANHYETPRHILIHAGYSHRVMCNAAFDVDKLAAIVGKDPKTLATLSYTQMGQDGQAQYCLSGHSLGRGLGHSPLRLRKPAICPQCIRDNGFADACWDLSVYVACAHHGTRLLSLCPACGNSLSWLRPGLLTCRCGTDLRESPSEGATSATVTLMRIIEATVHGIAFAGPDAAGFPVPRLSAMPLRSLLGLIATLAMLKARSSENVYDRIAVAADAFADWPHGFFAYLQRIGNDLRIHTAPHVGLRARFGTLYASLFKKQPPMKGTDFLRAAFIEFGRAEWGQSTVDQKLLRGENKKQRFVSATQFSQEAGVEPITVRQWVNTGQLQACVIEFHQQQQYYVLDSEMAANAKRSPKDRLEMRDAARRIGVPVSVLRELKRTRHYSRSPTINIRNGFWAFDLDLLVERICNTAELIPPGPSTPCSGPGDIVSLQTVLHRQKLGLPRAKGALILEILEGRIIPVGRFDDTIGSIQLHACDISAFRRRFAMDSERDTVTFEAAAKLVGCSLPGVRALVNEGRLTRKGEGQMGILRTSVDDFGKNWTGATVLASELDTNPASIASLAQSLGIEILRIRVESGNHTTFISFDDVQRLRDEWEKTHAKRRTRHKRLSPADVREQAMKSLREYLARLAECGDSVPMCRGKPNRRAVARACNIPLRLFYSSFGPQLKALMDGENGRTASNASEDQCIRLSHYLESLRANGQSLPMFLGKPNLSAISRSCAIPRNSFYYNPDLLQQLERLTP